MTSFAHTPGTRYTRAASARDAVERPRASGRSTQSARGHGGTEDFKIWVTHISATFRLISLCWTRLGGVRNGRDALVASVYGTQMLRMRRFGKDRCGYDARNTGLRHNRSLPRCRAGSDGPVHLASTIIQSSPIPLTARKPISKPSPCPRASARSVLTGRRPRNRPAPPLHGRNKLRPSRRPPSAIRHREGRNSLRPFIASRASEATPL